MWWTMLVTEVRITLACHYLLISSAPPPVVLNFTFCHEIESGREDQLLILIDWLIYLERSCTADCQSPCYFEQNYLKQNRSLFISTWPQKRTSLKSKSLQVTCHMGSINPTCLLACPALCYQMWNENANWTRKQSLSGATLALAHQCICLVYSHWGQVAPAWEIPVRALLISSLMTIYLQHNTVHRLRGWQHQW